MLSTYSYSFLFLFYRLFFFGFAFFSSLLLDSNNDKNVNKINHMLSIYFEYFQENMCSKTLDLSLYYAYTVKNIEGEGERKSEMVNNWYFSHTQEIFKVCT